MNFLCYFNYLKANYNTVKNMDDVLTIMFYDRSIHSYC